MIQQYISVSECKFWLIILSYSTVEGDGNGTSAWIGSTAVRWLCWNNCGQGTFFSFLCQTSLFMLIRFIILIFVFWVFPQTFSDADLKGDGKIDPDEWKEFVSKNPSLIKNMTLPYLKWVASSLSLWIVHNLVAIVRSVLNVPPKFKLLTLGTPFFFLQGYNFGVSQLRVKNWSWRFRNIAESYQSCHF
jgi:hypothetical protein